MEGDRAAGVRELRDPGAVALIDEADILQIDRRTVLMLQNQPVARVLIDNRVVVGGAGGRIPEQERVQPVTTVQQVIALAAMQRIGTQPAKQFVVAGVTVQPVETILAET